MLNIAVLCHLFYEIPCSDVSFQYSIPYHPASPLSTNSSLVIHIHNMFLQADFFRTHDIWFLVKPSLAHLYCHICTLTFVYWIEHTQFLSSFLIFSVVKIHISLSCSITICLHINICKHMCKIHKHMHTINKKKYCTNQG